MTKQVIGKQICTTVHGDGRMVRKTTTLYSDGSKDTREEEMDSGSAGAVDVREQMSKISLGRGAKERLQLEQCPQALTEQTANHVKEIFRRFDEDGSSFLDPSEVKAMCTELLEKEIPPEAAMQVLQAMDENCDKQISLGELLAFWPGIDAYLKALEADGGLKDSSTPAAAPPQTIPPPADSSAPPAAAPDASTIGGTGAGKLSDLERAVFHEINIARTQPAVYADAIEEQLKYIDEAANVLKLPGKIPMMMNEGAAAWKEAAAELRGMKPVKPLEGVPLGMFLASTDHAKDQAASGATGHSGSDGSQPSERLQRYGQWLSSCGENISYGANEARDIMLQLIIDAGVPSRGHRKNIYGNWNVVSIACGSHKKFRHMCVQNFAGGYEDGGKQAQQKRIKRKTGGGAQAAGGKRQSLGREEPVKARRPPKMRSGNGGARPAAAASAASVAIKVFSRQSCGACDALLDAFDNAGLSYTKADIDQDKSFFSHMTACGFKGGRFGLPVVVVGKTAHWSISDPHALAEEIKATAGGSALVEEDAAPPPPKPTAGDGAVLVYAREGCGRCTHLCSLLDAANVLYDKLDIDDDGSYFPAMIRAGFKGGSFGLPVVVVEGQAYWDIDDTRGLVQQLAGGDHVDPLATLQVGLTGTLSPSLANVVCDTFRRHDTSGDGCLSKDEITGFLDDLYQSLGLPLRPDEVQRKEIVELFREHDIDRNQKLSPSELAKYLSTSHFAASASQKKVGSPGLASTQ